MKDNIHAGAIALGEYGVLVRGAPGAGKSSFARAALAEWARRGRFCALVADDRTEVERVGKTLLARAPGALSGREEIRGIGIVETATLPSVRISLVADLEPGPERYPDMAARYARLLGIACPRLVFPHRAADHGVHSLWAVLAAGALTPPRDATQIDGMEISAKGELR